MGMRVVVLFVVVVAAVVNGAEQKADKFTEELMVTRLASGELLSQFRFAISTGENLGRDWDLFPRVVGELNRKYELDEWHLSLARGLWRTEDWGVAPQPAAPTGTQLDVWFGGDKDSIDTRWKGLVSELNGVFCVSLVELTDILVVQPRLTHFPQGLHLSRDPERRRLGNAARESVCTENLTPWRNLLPCRQYGLTSVLNSRKLYDSYYNSMSLHVFKACEELTGECKPIWRIELDLNVVHPLDLERRSLEWHLQGLFDRKITGVCEVAEASTLFVERDKKEMEFIPPPALTFGRSDGRVFTYYNLKENRTNVAWDVDVRYKEPLVLGEKSYENSLVSVHSWLSGVDQQSGALHTRVRNSDIVPLRAIYSHALPWYIRLYYHSLQVNCGSRGGAVEDEKPAKIEARNFVAAHDMGRPALVELEFVLPAGSDCHVDVEFDKAFMRMNDYPSDANHGMYIPPASVSLAHLSDSSVSVALLYNRSTMGTPRCTALEELSAVPIPPPEQPMNPKGVRKPIPRAKSPCEQYWTVVYGEALLVVLPVPDFSMPYNVLCLVATTFSLAYGPIFSYTTQVMIPQRWKQLGPSKWRKGSRVILLSLIAIALYGHFNEMTLTDMTKEVGKWLEKMNTMSG